VTVITVQKLFRTSITHFYFFHTESRVLSLDQSRSQVPTARLGCLRAKSRMVKKNLARAGRRLGVWNRGSKYETGAMTKPGLSRKIQVPVHKPSSLPRVDRNRACVFPGAVADTGPGTRSSLSFLSIAQEGKGLGTGGLCPNVTGTH
jgi:hypothetical protein